MCGYTLEEVEGLSSSILQGAETDEARPRGGALGKGVGAARVRCGRRRPVGAPLRADGERAARRELIRHAGQLQEGRRALPQPGARVRPRVDAGRTPTELPRPRALAARSTATPMTRPVPSPPHGTHPAHAAAAAAATTAAAAAATTPRLVPAHRRPPPRSASTISAPAVSATAVSATAVAAAIAAAIAAVAAAIPSPLPPLPLLPSTPSPSPSPHSILLLQHSRRRVAATAPASLAAAHAADSCTAAPARLPAISRDRCEYTYTYSTTVIGRRKRQQRRRRCLR